MELVLLLLLSAGFWLLLMRPQQQRLRAQRDLIASLEVGDQVVTAGGLIGRIVSLDERDAAIEVAPGTVLTFLRPAVSRRLEDVAADEDDAPAFATDEDDAPAFATDEDDAPMLAAPTLDAPAGGAAAGLGHTDEQAARTPADPLPGSGTGSGTTVHGAGATSAAGDDDNEKGAL